MQAVTTLSRFQCGEPKVRVLPNAVALFARRVLYGYAVGATSSGGGAF